MDEVLKTMYELCDIVAESLDEAKAKLKKSGGSLSVGDADYLDKLTHTMKSIKTTVAMMEAEGEDGGYSNGYWPMPYGRTYAGGTRGGYENDGYGGMSHARGRGRNARRDSMGRYSNESGYSYAEEINSIVDEMRGIMGNLPEEKRREVQRFIDKMDRM